MVFRAIIGGILLFTAVIIMAQQDQREFNGNRVYGDWSVSHDNNNGNSTNSNNPNNSTNNSNNRDYSYTNNSSWWANGNNNNNNNNSNDNKGSLSALRRQHQLSFEENEENKKDNYNMFDDDDDDNDMNNVFGAYQPFLGKCKNNDQSRTKWYAGVISVNGVIKGIVPFYSAKQILGNVNKLKKDELNVDKIFCPVMLGEIWKWIDIDFILINQKNSNGNRNYINYKEMSDNELDTLHDGRWPSRKKAIQEVHDAQEADKKKENDKDKHNEKQNEWCNKLSIHAIKNDIMVKIGVVRRLRNEQPVRYGNIGVNGK